MALSHSPKIVKDGLVLYLDAANSKSYPGSGTTWTDLSGNGNNGTLTNGPTFNTGSFGSIQFDGVDDYVNISNNFNSFGGGIGNGFTINCWVNTTSTVYGSLLGTVNNEITTVLAMNFNRGIGYRDETISATGATQFYLRSSNTKYLVGYITTNIYDGLWHNIQWKVNNTISGFFECWVDGVSQQLIYTDQQILDTWSNFDFPLVLGSLNLRGTVTNFSNFNMGNLSIYNRALSQEEITQNFNALRGRYQI